LHRKEQFLHKTDPRWDRFRATTLDEELAGLFENPFTIGYRDQWSELLRLKALMFVGHDLRPIPGKSPPGGDRFREVTT